jgi:hypothetical protein
MAASSPTAPGPSTATVEPGSTGIRSAAVTAMAVGSHMAAARSLTVSETRCRRWAGTATLAAMPPSMPQPGERLWAHSSAWPRRHSWQRPQASG